MRATLIIIPNTKNINLLLIKKTIFINLRIVTTFNKERNR